MSTEMNNTAAERQNRQPRLSPELMEVLNMLKSLEGQSPRPQSPSKTV